MTSGVCARAALAAVAGVAVGVLVGCEVSVGNLTGRAADEWTRSYPLSAAGEVEITNSNGRVEVEGTDGATVEVRAERIARAATDAGARELLPRITIKEEISPDRIAIETERPGGIMIGASFEVRYRVRLPKKATIRARTTNGEIALAALDGRVVARTTNGHVNGKDLHGGVEARTTNGAVAIELGALGNDLVELRTTNGGIQLTLPDSAKANLSASCTNGGITVSGLNFEPMGEQSRRRVRGRLNGGGAPVELTTTNGGIRVQTPAQAEREDPDPKP